MNVELGLSHWWPLAAIVAILAAAVVIGGYRRELGRVPPAGWLKLAALWLLTWWLLEPLHLIHTAPPQANVMLVVVDDSASMAARTLDVGAPAEVIRQLASVPFPPKAGAGQTAAHAKPGGDTPPE
ncbi:MAG: hypothetical protein D6725_05320, partial [Planctomycetota bacterium]